MLSLNNKEAPTYEEVGAFYVQGGGINDIGSFSPRTKGLQSHYHYIEDRSKIFTKGEASLFTEDNA